MGEGAGSGRGMGKRGGTKEVGIRRVKENGGGVRGGGRGEGRKLGIGEQGKGDRGKKEGGLVGVGGEVGGEDMRRNRVGGGGGKVGVMGGGVDRE